MGDEQAPCWPCELALHTRLKGVLSAPLVGLAKTCGWIVPDNMAVFSAAGRPALTVSAWFAALRVALWHGTPVADLGSAHPARLRTSGGFCIQTLGRFGVCV